ncbi:MAG: DNA polymerase [Methylotenera sp.]|nr:DNA polymerase [Methylotenera sp.]MDD4924925.1 DNA polymerase [Methylotenera sp.]
MTNTNVILDLPLVDECSLADRLHIQDSYTNDLGDAVNDDFYVDDDFDPEADFQRQLDRELQILDHQIADFESDPSEPHAGKGPPVYVGFDSEFLSGDKDTDNTVLSLQFYLVGECGVLTKIVYPSGDAKSERPSFYKTISRLIIEALETGIILEWPSRVFVCGFFLRIDLPAFADLVSFKNVLDSAGGRVTSINSEVEVAPDPEDLKRLLKNKSFIASDLNGMTRRFKVRFIDVGSHVAVGTSLAQMGDLIDLPKLLIPEGYSIERMDELLKSNKAAFEEYGLRDAEIAVKYFIRLLDFAEKHTGRRSLPATASGLGVRIFKSQLDVSGTDFNKAFGVGETSSTSWNNAKGNVITYKVKAPSDMRAIIEPFVASCYSGGRNECYAFGPTLLGVWNDFDLAGAYTTGLVDLRHIDYDNFKHTHEPADFVGHVLGFAYVEFEFPPEIRFPSLPVRGRNGGLFYPLTGKSYCTAPEIEVALNLGCKINIKHGLVIPWLDGDERLFEPYVTGIRKLRKSFVKGSIDELYAKLLGNSLYGKTAQGLKKKTVFDTKGMTSVELPHSELTNAAIAAHTTGFIRAVLSEQIAGVPSHRRVVSATTDGFITDADLSELDLSGPMAQRFQVLCNRVASDSPMLERKHRVRQIVAMKTRGQITGLTYDDEPLVLAKAGVSPNVPVAEHNDYMLNLFINRQADDMTQTRPFTPIRDQWIKNADVVRITREIRLNLEFDFKRKLLDPLMVGVADADHVSLQSVPWATAGEAEQARSFFDGWRRKRCLKTVQDWDDWDDMYQFSLIRTSLMVSGGKGFGIRATVKGVADVFRRLFLRAYTQGLCGLTRTMTYNQLAEWLTNQGYPTTADEVKNAKRAKFVEHAVPATSRVMQFASVLSNGFPSIEIHQFIKSN